jgi:hypothetical protein
MKYNGYFVLCLIILFILIIFLWYLRKRVDTFENSPINGRVQSSFPYKPPSKEELKESLYNPIIVRPPQQMVRKYSQSCPNELYPNRTSKYGKGEMTTPISATNEAKHYANRPILVGNGYNDLIGYLFDHISNTNLKIDDSKLNFQEQFSNTSQYSDVMKFVMTKINDAKNNLSLFKEYAKKDTWNGEHFAFLNEKIFVFQATDISQLSDQEQSKIANLGGLDGTKKIIVSFTLYNTLRSTSTDVIAIVFYINKKYHIKSIDFATKKGEDCGIEGQNLSSKTGTVTDINLNNKGLPGNENPDWIFKNTLENQTFNSKGYHDNDPSKNFTIAGGVPEELAGVLDKCENGYLLNCGTAESHKLKGSSDATNTVYPNYPNTQEKWSYST